MFPLIRNDLKSNARNVKLTLITTLCQFSGLEDFNITLFCVYTDKNFKSRKNFINKNCTALFRELQSKSIS